MNAPKTAIFTSCALNYIPKARLLAESVRRYAPDCEFWLLLCDEVPPGLDLSQEPFDRIKPASELGIKDFRSWVFQHAIVEACTAVKPFMLQWLQSQGYERVIYFDPDIVLFHTLEAIEEGFSRGSILLTPHLCEPEKTEEAIEDNEINSLRHGIFNFGFFAVKNDVTGRAYANWWARRCYKWCVADYPRGLFTDQKWNDHVPVFFDEVVILKNPGLNVATWNYAQRQLIGAMERGGIKVNGEPLVFHHFTGFDSGAHYLMRDKYGKHMPAAIALSEWYTASCKSHADAKLEAIPWTYGRYDNDEPVKPGHRLLYRQRKDLQDAFPDPFWTKVWGPHQNSYYLWLKNEGLLERADAAVADAGKPFGQFLEQTQAQLLHYISATPRLPGKVKAPLRVSLNLLFVTLKGGVKLLKKYRAA
jgi:hypothetical protein